MGTIGRRHKCKLIQINSRSIAVPIFTAAAFAGQRTHIEVFRRPVAMEERLVFPADSRRCGQLIGQKLL
jgi:hypothetical protein